MEENEEPLTGNCFVASYPPFSCWDPAHLNAYRSALDRPHRSDPFGIYVHIPFCSQRCHYCYYRSHDDRPQDMARYVDAVVGELRAYARTPAFKDREPLFVYFGGGTPSVLPARLLQRLLSGLRSGLSWRGVKEVTFECAPKSVTPEKLRILRDAGVTRVNLGAQQFNDSVLKQNGRAHLTDDIEQAYAQIRRAGFDVVNIDLMVGLVGETDESFMESLERTIGLRPESVTIYQMEIPFNTPLFRSIQKGELARLPAGWSAKRGRLARGFSRLEASGYRVRSAYAAALDSVRDPFVYQDEQYRGADLLGLGASALSHVAGVNQQNLCSVEKYLAAVSEGELPLFRAYALDGRERLVREFVLQLKLGAVPRGYFRKKFGVEPADLFAEPLERNAGKGWLTLEDDRIRLTREGLLRADHLLRDFYLERHKDANYW